MTNPLIEVQKFGQSIWYDNIRRGLITSGELQILVEKEGVLGVTSNPAIFEKAMAGSTDYDQATRALVKQGLKSAKEIYETLAVEDIQLACDVLYPVYLRTEKKDGYLSMEVSPYLAKDTKGTLEEARRLHAAIGRDNILIKVPATPEGVPAIQQLISEGISVNVTLLFAVEAYEAVAEAYLSGLETLAKKGGDMGKVASVASFFISRIDSVVDSKTTDRNILGKVAIANAKLAYARYLDIYSTDRWKALSRLGARPQRLLWASTGTKNPSYSKTIYVEELIGADTVNTVPAETLRAFRAEGKVRPSLTEDWDENLQRAKETIALVERAGISLSEVTSGLLDAAVKSFSDAFDSLLAVVERKRESVLGAALDKQTYSLGKNAEAAVKKALDDWRSNGKVRRLWNGDASLWTDKDEGRWLGWLHVVDGQREHPELLDRIAEASKSMGLRNVVLLGMGGSSLCPEVLKKTFGAIPGWPELLVLDSTVPSQVKALENKIDLRKTLFIVSSKSGGTTEPNVFKQYFFEKVKALLGPEEAGSRFIAVTDPGSKVERIAKQDRFRAIAPGVPSIGGRYSAMSNFGMVPAAAMGLDFHKLLDATEVMVQSCASCVPPETNPGVILGAIMGTLAKQGRDKVTFVTSPALSALGAWLEQLLAESTGKEGTGLIPIDDESVGPPEVYGDDRLFAYVRATKSPDAKQDEAVAQLEAAGHPVVRISVEDVYDLGQEFFRWEIATAVAGSILGINAFDQPDVEGSKVATRALSEEFEKNGTVREETPILESNGRFKLFADPKNSEVIGSTAKARTLESYLRAHLSRLGEGDYFAINAYVEMNEKNQKLLSKIRHTVRDTKKVATTLGFGPRFLHSTGQLHKGGPNSGVFLQVTADDPEDLPIPGQRTTFSRLKAFQAQGDLEVLVSRDRRVLRVHLGKDVETSLAKLADLVARAVN